MDIKSRLKRLVTPISDYKHQKGRLIMFTRKELEILSHTKFATQGRWEAHYHGGSELAAIKLYEENYNNRLKINSYGDDVYEIYDVILSEWDSKAEYVAPMKWIEVYDNKGDALIAYKGYQQLNLTPYLCGRDNFDMDEPEYYIIRDGETDED
jgi:hypothetical protein